MGIHITFCLLFLLMMFSDAMESKYQLSNLTMTQRLDSLFKRPRYDPRLRPYFNEKPVTVKVGFWVVAIDAINVMDMDFGLDIFLRQRWTDPRLDHGLRDTLSLSNTVISHIWLPDSYFKNAKDASFHDVTTQNMMITIGPGGLVDYNARVTLKASCPMDLRLYPMDVQHCPLIIESYGYDMNNIAYKWEIDSEDGMSFVPSDMKMLPQFKLTKLQLSSLYTTYVIDLMNVTEEVTIHRPNVSTLLSSAFIRGDLNAATRGNWSGVKASFTLQRLYSYQVIHLYGPSALIVTLSWLTFLLPRNQSPARVTLGVTSVLTIVTILTMSNNAMPKVNYVKAIDKYLIVSFLFVFCSLVEYAIVLLLDRGKRKFELRKKEVGNFTDKCAESVRQGNGSRRRKQSAVTLEENVIHAFRNGRAKSASLTNGKCLKCCSDENLGMHVPQTETQSNCGKCWNGVQEYIYREAFIVGVDEFSLKLFSFVFFTFNLFYWLTLFFFPDYIM